MYQSPTPYPLDHEGNELLGLKTFESILICFPFDHPSLPQTGLKSMGSIEPTEPNATPGLSSTYPGPNLEFQPTGATTYI